VKGIERSKQVEASFEAAHQHPGDQRAEFLRQACKGDPSAIRRERSQTAPSPFWQQLFLTVTISA
jgi:hypothetical protein